MNKKIGVAFIFILSLIACLALASATSCNSTANCSTNETCINSTCTLSTSTTVSPQQNLSKLDKAYSCLQNKTLTKCGSLSIQDMSLTILAAPSSALVSECKSALISKRSSSSCWPSGSCNVRDTALAVIALDSLGEDTSASETWLLNQNKTPTNLVWYLEQDSNSASQCKISYSGNDYTVNVGDDKKLDSSAGSCLSLSQSNFWLQVSPNCYNNEFQISCDKDFIATLLYQESSPGSPYFILSDTASKPSLGTISLKIKAQCISTSGNCDYESTAWATLALLKTGHNVETFIPYVIALADSNKRFLSDAFVYMATNYEDYGTKLIQEQQLGNHWEADSSAYGKFYDTALALIALKTSTADQVTKAKDWLLFSQSSNGCWSDSVKDTAIILWAMGNRAETPTVSATTTYCTSASYFCTATSDCPTAQTLSNYYCPTLGAPTCCMSQNLKTCAEYQGTVCAANKVCSANTRQATDTNSCCLGTCVDPVSASECEAASYMCSTSCSSNQEQTNLQCSAGVCCKTKITTSSGSSTWIWILIILILVILGVIIFLMRDRLRLWWFKRKNTSSKPTQTQPPRPGFPPVVRQPMQARPLPVRPVQKDHSMDDTFKRLREMSK